MKKKELFTMLFNEVDDMMKQVKRDQIIQTRYMEQMRIENEAFSKRIKKDMERRR